MSEGHAAQLAAVRTIATEVAARHAVEVDAQSRFPRESLEALKQARLLSAPVPAQLGGGGAGMGELAALCSTLARGCGASAMVLAMHYAQVACIVRHAQDSAFFREYLRELAARQYLLASMTS
ncbi:MAG TPA: acyl-CoA dehydrogenase family protein, partial [Steroidobacteraceae bacterium]|nr:acyl-CoA dehydrogenase family protein [Steroidobacteraceae bacterium]